MPRSARIRNEILTAYLADTAKSRMETATGAYPRVRAPQGKCFSAQDFFIRSPKGETAPTTFRSLPPNRFRTGDFATPRIDQSLVQAVAAQRAPQASRACAVELTRSFSLKIWWALRVSRLDL